MEISRYSQSNTTSWYLQITCTALTSPLGRRVVSVLIRGCEWGEVVLLWDCLGNRVCLGFRGRFGKCPYCRGKLKNECRELFACVLPDLDEWFETVGIFLHRGVDGNVPVSEPSVDDDV